MKTKEYCTCEARTAKDKVVCPLDQDECNCCTYCQNHCKAIYMDDVKDQEEFGNWFQNT